MNKHEETLLNPKIWFEFTRKQRRIGNILLSSLMDKKSLLSIRKQKDTAIDDFVTVFSNAHFHWGIAIENGFKGLIVKHQPETITYKIEGDDLIIKNIAGNHHNLVKLAEMTGVLNKEYGLYKYETDYLALIEVLKQLTEMVKWGARYPLPMDTRVVHKFSNEVPPTVVYGFHILDVMEPLFAAFDKEDQEI
jgi:hypothetical protein